MDSSNSSPEPVIALKDVRVFFGKKDTFCALDIELLKILPAERVFILGRSGSGKTTLTRLIKGRLTPSTGSVRVLDDEFLPGNLRSVRSLQRRIAMIDQEFFLIPRYTVLDNILSGCLGRVPTWKSLVGWYPLVELKKADVILKEVDLEGLGDRRVETLSGGQRQRTSIARALMQEADIILADEPISNLDPELAEEALGLLVACTRRRGVTLVVNLHQPSLARQFASRIIGLLEGKLFYDGSPDNFTPDQADLLFQSEKENSAGIKPDSQTVKHEVEIG